MKILIADDNLSIRALLQKLLEKLGFQVLTANICPKCYENVVKPQIKKLKSKKIALKKYKVYTFFETKTRELYLKNSRSLSFFWR